MIDWLEIDSNVKKFEDNLRVPNGVLSFVNFINIRDENDLLKIPKEGGCYWIWTNESILHSFHLHITPSKFDGGEIIYNGIAKDDIRGRIKKHLFGIPNEPMSAISVDILLEDYKGSHRKKAIADKGRTAFFARERILNRNTLLLLNFTDVEKKFIENSTHSIFFRNGINITDDKHHKHQYRVYYLCGFKSASYGDIIEKKWREQNGLPKLCTYKKGR